VEYVVFVIEFQFEFRGGREGRVFRPRRDTLDAEKQEEEGLLEYVRLPERVSLGEAVWCAYAVGCGVSYAATYVFLLLISSIFFVFGAQGNHFYTRELSGRLIPRRRSVTRTRGRRRPRISVKILSVEEIRYREGENRSVERVGGECYQEEECGAEFAARECARGRRIGVWNGKCQRCGR
jgi:hypothetical protein